MDRLHRIYILLAHISLWAVLFICVFLFRPHNPGMNEIPITGTQLLVSGLSFMAVFYLHAYWLMPGWLFRKKIAGYVFSLAGIWLAAAALPVLFYYVTTDLPFGVQLLRAILRRMLPVQFFVMASACVGAFRETLRLEKKRKEKETEHLRTELAFLRGQVNPHFMLNVLNSMVLLARRKSDLLEPVLMELAGLMSYMLYNTNNEKIGLEDEIKYLQAYIDLQLLRFGDDVTVQFNTSGMLDNRYIEPMLLIPLVENAFKHGIGLVGQPEIGIDIRAEEEDRLSMTVRNKYNPLIGGSDNRPTGIGLKNLRKRLELIYPGQYELNTGNNYLVDSILAENWFIITLNIPLQ
jgi:two-component system, LytTR family, sensor kinase